MSSVVSRLCCAKVFIQLARGHFERVVRVFEAVRAQSAFADFTCEIEQPRWVYRGQAPRRCGAFEGGFGRVAALT
jgi:hypothetical protein